MRLTIEVSYSDIYYYNKSCKNIPNEILIKLACKNSNCKNEFELKILISFCNFKDAYRQAWV